MGASRVGYSYGTMRIRLGELRRVIRESLHDGPPDVEDLAAYVSDGESGSRVVTIYDVGKLLGGAVAEEDSGTVAAKKVVVGYVVVVPSRHPCNGAWEVKYSAGPGYGKLVYGVGYAATPNNMLIPDREHVSPDAYRGWKTQQEKPGVEKAPLDYYKSPRTPDPNDDCEVHFRFDTDCGDRSAEPLNYSYVGPSWGKRVLSELEDMHREVMRKMANDGRPAEEFEASLPGAGLALFNRVIKL